MRKRILFLISILVIILTTSVLAFNLPSGVSGASQNSIVSLSSETVAVNEDFYLIINLSKIEYTNFRVDITNSSQISADELSTPNVTGLSTNNVATSFVVDKNSINLERIGVVYTAPNNETNINFEVIITNLENTVDSLTNELNTINADIETLNNTINELNANKSKLITTDENYETLLAEIEGNLSEATSLLETKTAKQEELQSKIGNYQVGKMRETIVAMVSNNTKDSKKSESQEDMFDMSKMDKDFSMKKTEDNNSELEDMKSKMSSLEGSLKEANATITSLSQDTTYKGSANNYLSSLKITGYEAIENSFKKTTSDYFLTIDENINEITVKAVAEDSKANVTVYGNSYLEKGRNKIIINVTAEDGSVRTYRVFVTK